MYSSCYIYVCMYVCMYVCVCVCVYIHIYTHTHTHTHKGMDHIELNLVRVEMMNCVLPSLSQ